MATTHRRSGTIAVALEILFRSVLIEDEEVESSVLAQYGHVTLQPEDQQHDSLKAKDTLKTTDKLKTADPLKINDSLKVLPETPPAVLTEEEMDIDDLLSGIRPGPPERAGFLNETRALFIEHDWGRPAEVSEIAIRLKNPRNQGWPSPIPVRGWPAAGSIYSGHRSTLKLHRFP